MRFHEVTVISDRVYNGVAVEKKRNSSEREREDISLYVLAHASLILGNRLNYSRVRNRIMGRARIWPSHVRLTSVSSPNRFIVRRKVPSILTDSIYSRDTLSPPPRTQSYRSSLYIRHLRITPAVAQVRCRANLRPLINILSPLPSLLESTLVCDFQI